MEDIEEKIGVKINIEIFNAIQDFLNNSNAKSKQQDDLENKNDILKNELKNALEKIETAITLIQK